MNDASLRIHALLMTRHSCASSSPLPPLCSRHASFLHASLDLFILIVLTSSLQILHAEFTEPKFLHLCGLKLSGSAAIVGSAGAGAQNGITSSLFENVSGNAILVDFYELTDSRFRSHWSP